MKTRTLLITFASTILLSLCSYGGLLDGIKERRKEVGAFDLDGDRAAQANTYLKSSHLDDLKGLKRVAITSFQLEVAVENSSSAHSQGASSKASAMLLGPEKSDFEAIANAFYDQVTADLQSAGLEIVPFDKIEADENYQKFKARHEPSPKLFTTKDGKSLFFSAKNLPLYFRSNDERLGGGSGIANAFTISPPQNYEPGIAKDLDAAVLRVRAVVDIAKQSTTSGGGFANVSTKAELNLMADFTEYMFVTPKGTATVKLVKHMNFAEQPAGLEKISKGSSTMPDLSALGGPNLGGISQTKAAYAIKVSPEDYKRIVGAHLKALEAMTLSIVKPAL